MEQQTNVVYRFKCSVGACAHRNMTYIGLTTTTLRRRMLAHRNRGGINHHFTEKHDRKPLLKELLENTTIIHRENQRNRLYIAEAVSIMIHYPALNTQTEYDFVLPSARRKAVTTRRNEPANENEQNVMGPCEVPLREPASSQQISVQSSSGNECTRNGAPGSLNSASSTRRQSNAALGEDQNVGLLGGRLRPRRQRPSYKE